jgi:hypothetical protein
VRATDARAPYTLEFQVALDPGYTRQDEAVFVFGIPKNGHTARIDWVERFPPQQHMAYPVFFKKLLHNADDIAHVILPYTVVKD